MNKRYNYCSYYQDDNDTKRPRTTEYRLKEKERIERLAKDYVIVSKASSEQILTEQISNSQMVLETNAQFVQGNYD